MPEATLSARALGHKSFVVGGLLTLLMAATALLSLLWTPHPVAEINIPAKLQAPSGVHWLGTDSLEIGRASCRERVWNCV